MLNVSVIDKNKVPKNDVPANSPVLVKDAVLKSVPSQELLRKVAWEIGEAKAAEKYSPTENHVSLGVVSPAQGFAHWRIQQEWIDQTSKKRGDAWHNCKLILRLYDVTCIEFNGFNAHRIINLDIGAICGQRFYGLPRAGTVQLAEVGFELRNGEFIPAARSQFVQFPPDSASPRTDHAALMVNDKLRVEAVANLWEHEAFLFNHRKPKLKNRLRIAVLAFESAVLGQHGNLAKFVAELSAGKAELGHDVHVFVPRSDKLEQTRKFGAVNYHPLDVNMQGTAIEIGLDYARAVDEALRGLPKFDLFHLHEWITGLAPWLATSPAVLSLSSIENTRLNGADPSEQSLEIQKVERDLTHAVECILTPDWLREKVIKEFGLEEKRVRMFSMEGRLPNEWESTFDPGKVKMDAGFGPLDRMLLYVGPLEHQSGLDVLVEAMPIALGRVNSLRIGIVGCGAMHGHLQARANQLGVGHAIRFFGDVQGPFLTKLMRAAEAVILPSRGRWHGDEGVVDLARKAARPVVTTHGGPAHLVKHEENGIVTYDNPGSMVWALDRILGDPNHANRMGSRGKHGGGGNTVSSWKEVAAHYLEICAETFPELTVKNDD